MARFGKHPEKDDSYSTDTLEVKNGLDNHVCQHSDLNFGEKGQMPKSGFHSRKCITEPQCTIRWLMTVHIYQNISYHIIIIINQMDGVVVYLLHQWH